MTSQEYSVHWLTWAYPCLISDCVVLRKYAREQAKSVHLLKRPIYDGVSNIAVYILDFSPSSQNTKQKLKQDSLTSSTSALSAYSVHQLEDFFLLCVPFWQYNKVYYYYYKQMTFILIVTSATNKNTSFENTGWFKTRGKIGVFLSTVIKLLKIFQVLKHSPCKRCSSNTTRRYISSSIELFATSLKYYK